MNSNIKTPVILKWYCIIFLLSLSKIRVTDEFLNIFSNIYTNFAKNAYSRIEDFMGVVTYRKNEVGKYFT